MSPSLVNKFYIHFNSHSLALSDGSLNSPTPMGDTTIDLSSVNHKEAVDWSVNIP